MAPISKTVLKDDAFDFRPLDALKSRIWYMNKYNFYSVVQFINVKDRTQVRNKQNDNLTYELQMSNGGDFFIDVPYLLISAHLVAGGIVP